MKKEVHPEYMECQVRCSCGNTWTTMSTVPELTLDLCDKCHPFYTGNQKLVDTGGRVQRFSGKFGDASKAALEKAAAEKEARAKQAEVLAAEKAEKAQAKAAEKAKRAEKYAAKAAKEAEKAAKEQARENAEEAAQVVVENVAAETGENVDAAAEATVTEATTTNDG